MTKIWYFPLEALEERYTRALDNLVCDRLDASGLEWEAVPGDTLTSTVEVGQVLDAESRHFYCFSQLQNFLRYIKEGKVKDGDILFNMDFWHSGIESIPYLSALRKWNLPTYGFVCAGSFEKWDFVNLSGMTPWASKIEEGWFELYRGVFVGNERMRQMVLPHITNPSKVHVTGLALSQGWIWERQKPLSWAEKEDIIVFPHRWDVEKDAQMFLDLAKMFPQYRFVHTTGRQGKVGNGPTPEGIEVIKMNTKEEYYQFLTKAKIVFSSALQDTVGNAMFESITLGAIPVVPEGQYNEYIPAEFRYTRGSLPDAARLIERIMSSEGSSVAHIASTFNHSVDRMIEVMAQENGLETAVGMSKTGKYAPIPTEVINV